MKPLGLLVLGILGLFIGLLLLAVGIRSDKPLGGIIMGAGLVLAAGYFAAKKSVLRIEYAGGKIEFSVKKYGLDNVRAFQRKLHENKEKLG